MNTPVSSHALVIDKSLVVLGWGILKQVERQVSYTKDQKAESLIRLFERYWDPDGYGSRGNGMGM